MLIAVRRLHLDDVRAEVGEHAAEERGGHHLRELEDADAGERSAHALPSERPRQGSCCFALPCVW